MNRIYQMKMGKYAAASPTAEYFRYGNKDESRNIGFIPNYASLSVGRRNLDIMLNNISE